MFPIQATTTCNGNRLASSVSRLALKLANSGPLCFVHSHDLRAEIIVQMEQPDPGRSLAVISNPRECASFSSWVQGFSPKERLEMIHAEQLQTFQAEQRERERTWQEEQRQRERKWQEEQNRANRRQGFLNVLIGGAIALAGGVLTKLLMG